MPRHVELDVRAYHAEGREPCGDIMAAANELEGGGCLVLRNTFEPKPLYGVLGAKGFTHQAQQVAEDDWCITFTKA